MVRSEVVDDLVQETFIKAWRSYSEFGYKANFRTWIYRIAMNTTVDYLRKKKEVLDNSEERHASLSQDVVELKDLIDKGLKLLEIKIREPFILFYKFNYTALEISNLMEIPEGTVKSRLFKAKGIFQSYLEQNGVNYER